MRNTLVSVHWADKVSVVNACVSSSLSELTLISNPLIDRKLYTQLRSQRERAEGRGLKRLHQRFDPPPLHRSPRYHVYVFTAFSNTLCDNLLWRFAIQQQSTAPQFVTVCLHKSGRCAVELYRAPHLWHPPLYTSPMASSAL